MDSSTSSPGFWQEMHYRKTRFRRVFLALVLLTLGGSVLCLQRQGSARLPVAPVSHQPVLQPPVLAADTQPVEATSQPTTYPSGALADECKLQAEKIRTRLDSSFRLHVSPPFVVAGNISQERLLGYVQYSIRKPAEAMWKGYFRNRPDRPITVLLLDDAASYRNWARKLFGDQDISHFGYYRPADRTLVMNIGTGTGTLVHELTHALIVYDWPKVPVWINEGLASLHEQSQIGDDEIRGLPNWRLPMLQAAIAQGELRSLASLAEGDFYGPRRGMNYAHARYFFLYLQSCGLLKDFYVRCRDAALDTPAVKVIESVCGRPAAEVDKMLVEYLKTLRWPDPQ